MQKISSSSDHLDSVQGQVLTPEDSDYTTVCRGYQAGIVFDPALIVVAAVVADVQAAVRHAKEHDQPILVHSTGHGATHPGSGGIMINTGRLQKLTIDKEARTARLGAGLTWAQVIEAAAAEGLAPLNGSAPGVGVVGYALGGGTGLMARQYGFAADHVRSIEIVTADAELLRVTADDHPELFWALRGAGANFGVVTEIEIDLAPVSRIYGGALTFDLAQTPELYRVYRDWTDTLPDELTSVVSLMPFPDAHPFPPPLRGRHIATVHVIFTGEAAEGKRLVEPLRQLGPIKDTVAEMPYAESGSIFNDPVEPHAYLGDSALLSDFDPDRLTPVLDHVRPGSAAMTIVFVQHLGGALSRPPAVPNAVGHRDARFQLRVLSMTDGVDRATIDGIQEEVLGAFDDVRIGRSLNFLLGQNASSQQISDLYQPADLQRLRGLKTKIDPANRFRFNRNIVPNVG